MANGAGKSSFNKTPIVVWCIWMMQLPVLLLAIPWASRRFADVEVVLSSGAVSLIGISNAFIEAGRWLDYSAGTSLGTTWIAIFGTFLLGFAVVLANHSKPAMIIVGACGLISLALEVAFLASPMILIVQHGRL